MQVADSHPITRSSRLEKVIRLFELGQASNFMDRVLDKVFAQEAADTRNAIARLDSDITNYEVQYEMSSEDFSDSSKRVNSEKAWILSSGVRL